MEHSFNINIAEQFDITVAIFLNNIAFWTKHNIANKQHYYDGRYWTFNTYDAFSILFPYWSVDQIKRIVNKCIDNGLLIKSNYNKKGYDQTNWYALTDLGIELFGLQDSIQKSSKLPSQPKPALNRRNRLIEKAKSPDRIDDIASPIPDTKQQIENTTTTSSEIIINPVTDKELIRLRNKHLPSDSRPDLEFLRQCQYHIEKGDSKYSIPQKIAGLKKLIIQGCFDKPGGYIDQKTKTSKSPKVLYSAYVNQIKADKDLKLIPNDTQILTYEQWIKQEGLN